MAFTAIDNSELYFQVKTYAGTGTATSTKAITLDGSENMQPNFVWLKNRTITANHALFDSVRGGTKVLNSNATTAEATEAQMLQSFDSDGFTVGTDSTVNDADSGNINIVSYNWKEDATAGFDIVSYTGNSSDGTTVQDISHSLSAVPHWIIVKNRADATNWAVYHKSNTSAPETEVFYLNVANATSDDSAFFGDTAPTSSQFRVGGDNGVNGNSDAMIAYLWSEVKGFSKFGSYTGNGNADGPFIYTGFKPAFVIYKRTNTGADWHQYDNKREPFNPINLTIFTNSNSAESSGDALDFLSNGFKQRNTGAEANGSGDTYVYMAFAESPFVNSKGIPNNSR